MCVCAANGRKGIMQIFILPLTIRPDYRGTVVARHNSRIHYGTLGCKRITSRIELLIERES